MNKNFKPNQAQIQAARNLMVAMAHVQLVEPIVTGYQRAILERHQWGVSPEMAELSCGKDVITDPKHAYLLSDANAAIYYAACDEAKKASGLKVARPDNCPWLEAQNQVLDAQRALVAALEPATRVTWDMLMRKFSDMPRYIELSLKLMAPFVGKSDQILADLMAETN